MVARLKLKGIDGRAHKEWNLRLSYRPRKSGNENWSGRVDRGDPVGSTRDGRGGPGIATRRTLGQTNDRSSASRTSRIKVEWEAARQPGTGELSGLRLRDDPVASDRRVTAGSRRNAR